MEFNVPGLYRNIHTKTAKLLTQKLLDQIRCTCFQDGRPIRLTWLMLKSSSFSPVAEIRF